MKKDNIRTNTKLHVKLHFYGSAHEKEKQRILKSMVARTSQIIGP
jgi:hypothetical protein